MQEYRLLVDSTEYSQELDHVIENSKESIYMQFLTFEADYVGKKYARLLIKKANEGLDVRVIIDGYYHLVINDRQVLLPLYKLAEFAEVRKELNRTKKMFEEMRDCGVNIEEVNSMFRGLNLLRRNHKKIVLIDKKVAFLGGFNLSEHNFAWHDFAVKISGSIVRDILEDFNSTWYSQPTEYTICSEGDFLLGNDRDNKILRDYVFEAIDNARDSICIESPYIAGRIMEKLVRAASKGVSISIIVPKRNNLHRHFFWTTRPLEQYMLDFAAKNSIHVYLYNNNGGMTHAKVMLVDDKLACFGSCNFDAFGFRFYKDLNLVSRNQSLVNELRMRLIEKDLSNSEAFYVRRMSIPNYLIGRLSNFFYSSMIK